MPIFEISAIKHIKDIYLIPILDVLSMDILAMLLI